MRALGRTPLAASVGVSAIVLFVLAGVAKTGVLMAALLVVGCAVVASGTVSSLHRLGVRRSIETSLAASSVGPWTALAGPHGTVSEAVLISAVAIVVAVKVQAEAPQIRAEGLLGYFGLRQRAGS